MKNIAPASGALGVASARSPETVTAHTDLNISRPLPANGQHCEYSGLGHTRLYRLLCNPGDARAHVRLASLRKPGQARTTGLYRVGDLVAYLLRLAEEQKPATQFASAEGAA
jgi:hypothetical protein